MLDYSTSFVLVLTNAEKGDILSNLEISMSVLHGHTHTKVMCVTISESGCTH